MKQKFDKGEVNFIIKMLRGELADAREDIRSSASYEKDIEKKIKELKQEITELGKFSDDKTPSPQILSVSKYRKSLEESLAHYRQQFKVNSKVTKDAKSAVRVLEHAIETLRKEFAEN